MEIKDSTKARDVMRPVRLAVTPRTTLIELRDMLLQYRCTGAPVINEDGDVVGVISQSDLVRAVVGDLFSHDSDGLAELFSETSASADPLVGKTVSDIMVGNVFSVAPADPIGAVARLMVDLHIHRVIVTEHSKPVGVISSMDLISLLAS